MFFMENKSTGKTVVIIILVLLVLGLGGYIVYDKMLSKESAETKESAKTEKKVENQTITESKKSIAGSYIYDGKFTANPDLTAHLELKLNEDNTFILYEATTDAMAFKGTYTLNNSKLMLYAIEMDASQAEPNIYEVNSDTFECTYDVTNNTVNINKWNQHYYNDETKKVDYNTFTDYNGLKLTENNNLEHIGKDRFVK